MNLKQLKERKVELLNSMKDLTENVEIFNNVQFEEMKAELETVENSIKEFDNATQIENKNIKVEGDRMKLKEMLMKGQAVDLSKVNNAGEMIRPDHEAIQVESFEATIEKKVEEECLLFAKARKIMTASTHNIPVQAEKLDKFLNVKELAEYQRDMPRYDNVVLGAEKYGLVVVASEELLEDEAFGLEADIKAQLVEAFAKTMEDLIINGDQGNGVEGLLTKADKVVQAEAVDFDAIVELIFAIKKEHRRDACLIVSDEFMKQVFGLKDLDGRPLLRQEIVDMKEADIDGKILGVPVIVSPALPEDVLAIHANLQKAIVVGVRRGMQIKKSDEVLFLTDAVAFKANCRVDVKVLDKDAIAVMKRA